MDAYWSALEKIRKFRIHEIPYFNGHIHPQYDGRSFANFPDSICRWMGIPSLHDNGLAEEYHQGLEGPFHGPEVEYVKNGKTGFLVSNGDVSAMAEKVIDLISDKEIVLQMRKNIREALEKEFSINRMMDGFSKAILFCENK